ncbi:hypothetical protein EDD15DRAFT_2197821 [Pisolithus albus]|nr:hypothetical protein EDD15DRAFT_2197821 [Pisolithus albus]
MPVEDRVCPHEDQMLKMISLPSKRRGYRSLNTLIFGNFWFTTSLSINDLRFPINGMGQELCVSEIVHRFKDSAPGLHNIMNRIWMSLRKFEHGICTYCGLEPPSDWKLSSGNATMKNGIRKRQLLTGMGLPLSMNEAKLFLVMLLRKLILHIYFLSFFWAWVPPSIHSAPSTLKASKKQAAISTCQSETCPHKQSFEIQDGDGSLMVFVSSGMPTQLKNKPLQSFLAAFDGAPMLDNWDTVNEEHQAFPCVHYAIHNCYGVSGVDAPTGLPGPALAFLSLTVKMNIHTEAHQDFMDKSICLVIPIGNFKHMSLVLVEQGLVLGSAMTIMALDPLCFTQTKEWILGKGTITSGEETALCFSMVFGWVMAHGIASQLLKGQKFHSNHPVTLESWLVKNEKWLYSEDVITEVASAKFQSFWHSITVTTASQFNFPEKILLKIQST